MDDYRQHTEAATTEPRNPVFDGIERAIHEQRLPPGTRLAEGELGDIYGVSRTIVRAGLQELAHARLVSLRHNRGARVAQPSPQEAREVFEARELIEPRTTREAARRFTQADFDRLRAHCAEEQKALAANDHGLSLRLSGIFHIEIARVAGQQTLLEFVDQLVARSALIIALYWGQERVRCDRSCHEHILNAMVRNDPDEAESLMRSHLIDIHSSLRFNDEPEGKQDLRSMLT